MVTATVMLMVRKVGSGTIMRPIMTATKATKIRSAKRVSTPVRFPPRISFWISSTCDWILAIIVEPVGFCSRQERGQFFLQGHQHAPPPDLAGASAEKWRRTLLRFDGRFSVRREITT